MGERHRKRQRPGVLLSTWRGLRTLFSGVVEVFSILRRLIVGAFRVLGKAIFPPRGQGYKLPTSTATIAAIGSAAIWIAAVVLAADIRFARSILPADDVDIYTERRQPSITILDRNGEILGVRGSFRGEAISFEELPPYLVDAFIATEDRRFFSHPGFDVRGLLRAQVANMRAGNVVQGGSTITQQLARDLFLTREQTLSRKLEEIHLALWLEARLSKEEILNFYLNRVYLGGGAYGVDAASKSFFSKPPSELSLPEAAVIAGLPQAPSANAPTANWDGALIRSREVLDNLVEHGRLTRDEANAAKLVPPQLALRLSPEPVGYFLDYVRASLEERFGDLTTDLIVKTTLDPVLQALAHDAVNRVLDASGEAANASQAGLIAFDDNGGIVAMVGGRDYGNSQFNRATQARRQPGSTFKPFVFLAALEAGLSPETVLVDQPVRVGTWVPRNFSGKHRGPLRLSTAVARSTNSIAVQVTEAIGRDRVIDAAQRAGISTKLDPLPSLALGAMELTLEELTAAFMPFAHGGREIPPHAIVEVTTRDGTPIDAFAQPIDGYSLIEQGHADEVARMLMQVTTTGTGRRAQIDGWQVAGKTGTTNDWRDAWFVGFTSAYTAGVWVGNDKGDAMNEVTGSSLPLDIWLAFMRPALENESPRPLLRRGQQSLQSVARLDQFYATLRLDLRDVATPGDFIAPWSTDDDQVEALPGFRRDQQVNRRPAPIVGRAAPGANPPQGDTQ